MGTCSSGDKLLAVLAHASFFFCPILLPLIFLLVSKEDPFVRHHARQALGCHLFLLVALAVSWILCVVLIGFVLVWFVWIYGFLITIIAIIRTVEGDYYRYPICGNWL